ncbi:hypothetical protein DSL64_23285 [Dyadobacter luteus]|uniref:Uncharacterized protein n=1 Tax=Dyadobacter luteus TaxID=2259619 RepID=A0A3D8Y648_9BACT|nr:hypothetical protein [Dyadobacter luteus]REA57664.1 hypothetical protein DSL64_23285 [Dyadobacter luteus]
MNQTFDLQRFWLFLKLDWAEKGRKYLLTGGLLLVIMMTLMLPIILTNSFSQILMLLHALALFMVVMFGGSLYTSTVFTQYGTTDTATASLMVPASQLEKFLVPLLLNLIFIIPVTFLFSKLHFWFIGIANSSQTGSSRYSSIPYDVLRYFIYLHMIIQGCVFLGSIYFRKLSYVKTAVLLFFIAITFTAVHIIYIYKVTDSPAQVVSFPFSAWKLWYSPSGKHYYLAHSESEQALLYTFPILFLLTTWYISFVRLKEKEI